jgi:hypothetical protein
MSEDNRGNGADTGVVPLAARMYPHLSRGESGELGEGGLDQARRMQQEGVAKPDPRFPEAARPERSEPAFDAARYRAPDGAALDLGEFSAVARDLHLSQQQAEKLLSLHTKETAAQRNALERQWNDWYRETERHFGDRLPEVVADIKASVGNDRDAAEFYRLLEWSGMSYSPAVLRVLHRLAGGRRW